MRIIALAPDLEGTLISNAVSQCPRRGLRAFLEPNSQPSPASPQSILKLRAAPSIGFSYLKYLPDLPTF